MQDNTILISRSLIFRKIIKRYPTCFSCKSNTCITDAEDEGISTNILNYLDGVIFHLGLFVLVFLIVVLNFTILQHINDLLPDSFCKQIRLYKVCSLFVYMPCVKERQDKSVSMY